MDVTPLIPADRQVIDGYGDGQFCVRGTWLPGPLIVFPDRTLTWEVTGFAALTVESFAPITEADPPVEILLLGAGPRNQLVPRALRESLRARGVVVDGMDTGAACRTYNVLLAEGRRVAAALLPA
ncbi:Mth938-like domain-containing protein [Azospirillum sp. TSO22-1]|uniref:Mth938-like domain-containing protein n=1 Tax=Azospirillum sp. TSO22-1 TaxID=716789 RepID=UPI000D613906|nr:Mth938-like domain-containing protein [Azospirillum sp. TSO22-1]PWC55525.1 valyl-tRNA synthetase [Azospirillum sp. TSO22-1]